MNILRNIVLLLSQSVFRMVLNFGVAIVVARYLGPAGFGAVALALTIVTILTPLNKLGMDGIVSRDIARETGDGADRTLGSALALRFAGSAVQLVAALAIAWFIGPGDTVLLAMVAIVATGAILRIGEAGELWFRAKQQALPVVLANNLAVICSGGWRLGLVFVGAPVLWFASAEIVFALALSIALAVALHRAAGSGLRLSASWPRMRELIGESWPFLLSGAAALVYLKIDVLMLGHMASREDVGLYSAAARLPEAAYTLSAAIIWAVQSSVVRRYDQSRAAFERALANLLGALALVAYAVFIPMAVLSPWLMRLVFGPDFAGAGPLLAVLAVAGIFVYMRAGYGLWATLAKQGRFILVTNCLGAALNVGMNLYAIPAYGAAGAAVVTLISYIFAYYLAGIFYAPARRSFVLQSRALAMLEARGAAQELLAAYRARKRAPSEGF